MTETDKRVSRDGREPNAQGKATWWKRPLVWIGSVATAGVIAAVAAIGHNIGQTVHIGSAGTAAKPLIVEGVSTQFYQDYSFVTMRKTPLTRQQLGAMNNGAAPLSPPRGAIIANQEWIVLTVAGNSPSAVTINELNVVKRCQKPLSGMTLFYRPSAGAGAFATAPILVDLDSPATVGQYLPSEGDTIPAGGNFFAKKVITLGYHEPQTLAIFATSVRQYCQFTFNLSVATVNGLVTEKISDHGKPFAITADGEPTLLSPRGGPITFPSYAAIYAGGKADQQHNYKFVRVNPATYHGSGDPASFPVH